VIAVPPPGQVLAAGTPDGPCLVFVHGIEDSWQTWTELARWLDPRWRLLALDLPWRAGNDYRWRWVAGPGDWVAAGLAAALGERRCVLVGHSFGANAVLARLAGGEPRVAAAVLAAPFFRPAGAAVTWQTFDLSREAFERQVADGILARLRRRPQPEVFELMLARTCERIGPVGFLAVFEQYLASGHLPLSHVDIPALVLAGDGDPGMVAPHLRALAGGLPRGRFARGAGLDHFCHIHQAPEVARAIEQLVAAAGPAGAGRRERDGRA
jgi:pimeloyl-ACP methyl ester carboxylesterase